MNLAIKITLASAGMFLLTGMIGGVIKYQRIMASPDHKASAYVDLAHRAALLYSFSALVMAELLRFSPFSVSVQLLITGVPLFNFAVSIAQYFRLGFTGKTTSQFSDRNLITTWGMVFLIVGEIGGVGAIVLGFIITQFFS